MSMEDYVEADKGSSDPFESVHRDEHAHRLKNARHCHTFIVDSQLFHGGAQLRKSRKDEWVCHKKLEGVDVVCGELICE